MPLNKTKGFKYNELYSKPASFLDAVSFLKFVNTTAGINKLLFACEEGVTFVADIHFKRLNVLGGAGLEGCATCTNNRYFMIIGMYIGLHYLTSLIIFTFNTIQ